MTVRCNIQVRIFTEALLDSSKSQFPGEIYLRREELVDSNSPRFCSDNIGHLFYEFRVEGASHAYRGVENGSIKDQDSVETFALDKGRDSYDPLDHTTQT